MKPITKKLLFASGVFIFSTTLLAQTFAANNTVNSQAGDVTHDSAVLWARCNLEQDALLTFSLTTQRNLISDAVENINIVRKKSHKVSDESDYTGSLVFKGLKSATQYYYQATCKPLAQNPKATVTGTLSTFKTTSDFEQANPARFVWATDLGGQGWGRNPDLSITHVDGELIKGGYVVFDSMSKLDPDFALFQGDRFMQTARFPPLKTSRQM